MCRQLKEKEASLAYTAKRFHGRCITDMEGRGTVRMCVESMNLLTMRTIIDVTNAESVKSHLTGPLNCDQYIACEKNQDGNTTVRRGSKGHMGIGIGIQQCRVRAGVQVGIVIEG